MDREELLSICRSRMSDGFDKFFEEHILMGRPMLVADVSSRTYPYTDLVMAYSHGLSVAVDIVEDLMQAKRIDK